MELIFIIIHQYVHACDNSYYPIMSLNFQNKFDSLKMILYTSQKYLVSLCFLCI